LDFVIQSTNNDQKEEAAAEVYSKNTGMCSENNNLNHHENQNNNGWVRNSAHITWYYSNTPFLNINQLAGLHVGSAGPFLIVSLS
jgi:hypothetical protein